MGRHKGPATPRGVRVAAQLHHEVAELIRSEVKDPRVGLVTITGVDLTPDYAYLTVHWSVLPDDDATVAATRAGLERAAGFLRGRIGRRVRIHTTPEIRFAHDRTTEHGIAMSRLIDRALETTIAADEEPTESLEGTAPRVPIPDRPDDGTRR